MPKRKKLTAAEKREVQEGLKDWLAVMDFQLHEFIASLPYPVAVALDFSRESLNVLEAWLLETYPTVEALRAESEKKTWDRLGRYIGETIRRNTNGRWDIELNPDYAYFKVPQLVFSASSPECPHTLSTVALDRRTGKLLGRTLDRLIGDMKAAGHESRE